MIMPKPMLPSSAGVALRNPDVLHSGREPTPAPSSPHTSNERMPASGQPLAVFRGSLFLSAFERYCPHAYISPTLNHIHKGGV